MFLVSEYHFPTRYYLLTLYEPAAIRIAIVDIFLFTENAAPYLNSHLQHILAATIENRSTHILYLNTHPNYLLQYPQAVIYK